MARTIIDFDAPIPQAFAGVARYLPPVTPVVTEFAKGYQAALADILMALETQGEAGVQEWIEENRRGW